MESLKKEKSRHLSVYQFFQILQLEWIVADLRSKIYPKKKDKEYWNKVKEGKEKIFEQIAEKNHLPTIFSDEEMRRLLEMEVYKPQGLPNFLYKNDENRGAQEPFDLTYYYSKGAEVRFDVFGEQKIGKVKSYLPYQFTIIVTSLEGEDFTVRIESVTRIL